MSAAPRSPKPDKRPRSPSSGSPVKGKKKRAKYTMAQKIFVRRLKKENPKMKPLTLKVKFEREYMGTTIKLPTLKNWLYQKATAVAIDVFDNAYGPTAKAKAKDLASNQKIDEMDKVIVKNVDSATTTVVTDAPTNASVDSTTNVAIDSTTTVDSSDQTNGAYDENRTTRRVPTKARCRAVYKPQTGRFPEVEQRLAAAVRIQEEHNFTRDEEWCVERSLEIKKMILFEMSLEEMDGDGLTAERLEQKKKLVTFAASKAWFYAFLGRHCGDTLSVTTNRPVSMSEYLAVMPPFLEGERKFALDNGCIIVDANGVPFIKRSSLGNGDEVPLQLIGESANKQVTLKDNKEDMDPSTVQLWTAPSTRAMNKRTGTFFAWVTADGWKHTGHSDFYKKANPVLLLPGGPTEKERSQYAKYTQVYTQKNAWMTTDIWRKHATRFVAKVKRTTDNPLLLYCDNLSSHMDSVAVATYKAGNMHIRALSPRCTHFQQMWDQHIGKMIQTGVKKKFRGYVDRAEKRHLSAQRKTQVKLNLQTLRCLMSRWTEKTYVEFLEQRKRAIHRSFFNSGLLLRTDGKDDAGFYDAMKKKSHKHMNDWIKSKMTKPAFADPFNDLPDSGDDSSDDEFIGIGSAMGGQTAAGTSHMSEAALSERGYNALARRLKAQGYISDDQGDADYTSNDGEDDDDNKERSVEESADDLESQE